MRIDTRYQIWQCAAEPDSSRPVLSLVLIERTGPHTGLVVASDGFCLAVIPVHLHLSDSEMGLVSAESLKSALELAQGMSISMSETLIGSERGWFPRLSGKTEQISGLPQFPNYRAAIPKRSKLREAMMVFDISLLTKVSLAIGSPKPIILTSTGLNSPILVECMPLPESDEATPPFGVLMSMHLSGTH